MRILSILPRLLVKLPYRLRFNIVALSFLLSVVLMFYGFPSRLNGSLLALPVALAAWLFKGRGAFICVGSAALALLIVNSISVDSLLWPRSLIFAFLIGILVMMAEGFVIAYLRNSLDLSDAARLKAEEAEKQLALAYEQQHRLNQIKDQFLLNVNHELRTPLTAIHGYLELLREYSGQLDPALASTFLENALHGCEELQLLVNNVLDAVQSEIGIKPSQLEKLAVGDLVREVLEQFDPRQHQEYAIQLHVPAELVVWADGQHVRQVLRNLLSNAFKYSPLHTPITISATLNDTRPTSQVAICIKDAGPGIPPAEIPLLFGKFVRLKRDLSGIVRGSGLGLYISKQLVEAMGGTIWAESSGVPGDGSSFCFTLPCAPRCSN